MVKYEHSNELKFKSVWVECSPSKEWSVQKNLAFSSCILTHNLFYNNKISFKKSSPSYESTYRFCAYIFRAKVIFIMNKSEIILLINLLIFFVKKCIS